MSNKRFGPRLTRRQWLQGFGAISAGVSLTAVGGKRVAGAQRVTDASQVPERPLMQELAQTGVAAAVAAGATYADARLTHVRSRGLAPGGPMSEPRLAESEALTVGVRALVNGYWGFASSPIWDQDELDRLGQTASMIARINGRTNRRRVVELAPAPVVRDGSWQSPMRIDPFEISLDEIFDYFTGLNIFGTSCNLIVLGGFSTSRRTQTFASSEGSSWTYEQTLVAGDIAVGNNVVSHIIPVPPGPTSGWECIIDRPVRELIPELGERIRSETRLPVKPATLSKKDVIVDGYTMAALASNTLGHATELDRAMGYEANDVGTSYLNTPLELLGTPVASPAITLRTNATLPGGVASVPWDDDGVAATENTLVRQGTLVDFQKTRESATWLARWYTSAGIPVRSNGCAFADSALFPPLTRAPNFIVEGTGTARTLDEVIEQVDDGIYVEEGRATVDFQCLNGTCQGRMYEIKGGRRVARLVGGSIEFHSPQLWKNAAVTAGPEAAQPNVVQSYKGQPTQYKGCSAIAVPGIFKNVTIRGSE